MWSSMKSTASRFRFMITAADNDSPLPQCQRKWHGPRSFAIAARVRQHEVIHENMNGAPRAVEVEHVGPNGSARDRSRHASLGNGGSSKREFLSTGTAR